MPGIVSSPDRPGRASILIVDDMPLNVAVLSVILALTLEGYVISAAYDGFAALAKIEVKKPDLILLDVMMPRMDGFEVCRRVRAAPATARVRSS
jgi:CheY-like chemotaxis protein